ncbi:MAG: SsrA-binding protein SmpB [Candidatus Methylomirabilia bacterium]
MAPSQGDRTAQDRTVATNRRARHDYEILETYEAGLALLGTEVKSLREGKAHFKDSYARVDGEEVWLVGCHISPYRHGTHVNHDPDRKRKLLLRRREINRLMGKTLERGLTLVPLRLYFKRGARAKVELALARGRKVYDKRQTLREREARREMDKAVRGRFRAASWER